ncbi:LOW QUALITY PROTEIN: nuclear envelope pore membrane protein POM 121-like, partial [Manis pentadactyla]|uniref:LOW QUALITY PROTEIN: nuclear envelope pore membrane protein POM 121-like n=1 Tax=Manis pentadactyla TaxID=143292 RepID=UPI00255C5EEB
CYRAAQIPKARDPWSKEAVLLALQCWKRKKRTVEEEEDQTSAAGQEDKRRCHDSSGSGHSAFKPEVANGVPAAFVPEPGPLQRGLSSQSSDGELRKRTCTSAVSCSKGTCTCGIRMSSRNAITSSYTSTGGISQLWKRRPSASSFSSPASSRSQTPGSPEKKMREEDGPQGSGSSAPPVNKESQGEQDTTTCREQNSWDSPPTPSSSQPHRRKVPLVPSRRGILLILPPAPWISGSITVEEYYQEKQAQSQWLKRIFEDKTGKEYGLISHSRDSSQTRVPPRPSSDSRYTAPFSGLTPASPAIPASDATNSPPASQAETSAKPQAPPAAAPTLKPSVLFGTLSRPPANPSASAAPAVSSARPTFKPIFVAPSKSGKEGPVPSSHSQVTTEASSSSAHTPTTSSLPTFSPVFSSTGLPTSLPLSTPSSFSQTTTSGTSMNTPLYPGPFSVSIPSAAAWGTTTGTAADSAQKPVFGFGVSSVTSTASSMTSPTASTAQPVFFGSPLASAASSAQPWAPYSSLAGSGHSLPGAIQTAAGSSTAGFGGFSGTLTTSAPIAPSQPALTLSSTATPAFNTPFGSGTRPPVPSYPGVTPQHTFGATQTADVDCQPALAPSFGSSFPFGSSAALAPPQPAFGTTVWSGFRGLKPAASLFGTISSTQSAFGSTTAVSSNFFILWYH